MFTIGSALCATAWSIEALIVFRIIQGLGGGMLLPGGQAIIAKAAGPQRLGRAMSIIGVPMLLGPVFGPVIGGALIEYTSWHWIFLVNVPIVLIFAAMVMVKVPARTDTARKEVRFPGLRLFIIGAAIMLVALMPTLSGFRDAFAYLVLIVILLARPTGLLGREFREKV